MSKEGTLNALSKEQAYQLADITKTPPQFGSSSIWLWKVSGSGRKARSLITMITAY